MTVIEFKDNYNFSSLQMIRFFDQWASQDLKDEFMDQLSRMFDLPESLDDSVEDYVCNSFVCSEDSIHFDDVVVELSQFLSTSQSTTFTNDLINDYDLDYND